MYIARFSKEVPIHDYLLFFAKPGRVHVDTNEILRKLLLSFEVVPKLHDSSVRENVAKNYDSSYRNFFRRANILRPGWVCAHVILKTADC
jgi:hypothetical protein